MKKLFAILLLTIFVGCKDGGDNLTPGEHLEAAFKHKKTRYFFIGYMATDGNEISHGNFFHIADTIPILDSLNKWAFDYGVKEGLIKLSQVTTVGFYEFKDSIEYAKFRNK